MVFIPRLNKKVWAGYLAPFEDELLSSWLSRIAVSHYTTPHAFAREYSALAGTISRSDIDLHPPERLIASILEWTPLSPKEVEAMLLRSYLESEVKYCLNGSNIVLKIQKRHRRSFRPAQLYCPGCITGDRRYFKKLWRLSMSIACSTCGERLRESCPKCQRPILFYKDGTHIQRYEMPTLSSDGIKCCCGSALDPAAKEEATPEELDYQRRIECRLGEQCGSETPQAFSYFYMLLDLAEKLGRSHSLTKSKAVINKYFDKELPFHNRPMGQWELRCRMELLPYADLLLNEWPANSMCIIKSGYYKNANIAGLPHWFRACL